MSPDPVLVERLKQHDQAHLLRWWNELDQQSRASLAADVSAIDFDRLDKLIAELVLGNPKPAAASDDVQPIDVMRLPQTDGERLVWRRASDIGAEALAAGEVGVILVAGGSGTRLGFEGPKGTFPIGPVSSASLFQIHAEKIVALGRRYGQSLPLYIMTSPENHQATIDFFDQHDRFGLEHVRFFTQGQMPAFDRSSGKILLAGKDKVALSPDGHGGTITALAAPGSGGGPSCLDEMRERGLRTLVLFPGRQSARTYRRSIVHRPAS